MEALIGAVYIDQGLPVAEQLIERLFGERLTMLAATAVVKDAKSRLQEYVQSIGAALPSYKIVSEIGPAHQRWFEMEPVF